MSSKAGPVSPGRSDNPRRNETGQSADDSARFRSLLESIDGVVFRLDRDQRCVDVYGRHLRRQDIAPDMLLGRTVREILGAAAAPIHEEANRRALAGETVTYDWTFRGPRGERHMQTTLSPEYGARGEIAGIVGVGRDLTERRRSEQALRLSQQNYAALVDSIDGIVWEADAHPFCFTFVSRQAERLLGYPIECWLEDPAFWSEHIHPADREWAVAFCLAATAERRSHDFEYRMVAADGRTVWLRDIVSVVIEEEQCVRLRGVMVDITERKSVEEALCANVSRVLRQESALIALTRSDTLQDRDLIASLRRITEVSARTLGVARVSVWLYTPDRTAIRGVALYELHEERHSSGTELPVAEYPAYFEALATGDVIPADDAMTDPRTCEFAPNYLAPLGITSMMDAPVRLHGTLGGVVCHEHTGPKRQWTSDERAFAIAVANLVSLVLDEWERRRAEEALVESEQRYRKLFDVETDAEIVFDAETLRIEDANRAALALLGYSKEELLVLEATDVADDPRQARAVIDSLIAGGSGGTMLSDRLLRKKGGAVFPAEISLGLFVARGRNKIIGAIRDITERKVQEEKILRLSRVREVLSNINATILRVRDRATLFQETCRIAVEAGGFRLAGIAWLDERAGGLRPVAWRGVDEDPAGEAGWSTQYDVGTQLVVDEAVTSGCPRFFDDISALPGLTRREQAVARGWHSLAILPLVVEGRGMGAIALYGGERHAFDGDEASLLTELAADISFGLEVIDKQEKLDYLAYYDPLTGLPNRTLFDDRLGQYLQAAAHEGTSRAVLLIDVRRFRHVNETLGRHIGDALLKLIGRRLRDLASGRGTVARVGMDGFAVALGEPQGAEAAAHFLETDIFSSFARPFQVEGSELRVDVCVGVSLCPADGNDTETLVKNAERALKNAKRSGDRYLFYAPEMNARIAHILTLENKLRRALEENQFVLYLQPQVHARSGVVTGVEGLLRWRDPDGGLIPPAQFIPVLEETGLIHEVGQWVMEEALLMHRRWIARLPQPPRIAVNVSALQLRKKDFVETVRRVVDRAGGVAHGLDLEITESLVMEDIETNIAKLGELKDMGVGVAIDDFGTGYSSLSYIAKLPIDALKIDRSFIEKMGASSDETTIVSSIISLAHALELRVVAEGVETEEQATLLRLLKCDEMQGHLFCVPAPAERIREILTAGNVLKPRSG